MVETVELKKIVNDDNRKYTKDEGFEQLVRSIKEYGIIEPPVVRMLPNGYYRLLAGRRRIAAARKLKLELIDCVIREDDGNVDEEIALTENVNRLEMHPLDEAALFKRMAYGRPGVNGKSVEEIAKYYARSPSAIYKRLRLNSLVDELKGMFRDGKLDISGAAVLAELPEDDQKEFYNLKNSKAGPEDEDDEPDEDEEFEIDNHEICNFVFKKQKNIITESMKGFCEGCKKRTHNEENALFKEYAAMQDVCLDGDCYRVKQLAMINTAFTAAAVQMNEAGLKTDDRVFFEGGAPERIYKSATKARFEIDKKPVEFEVLRAKDYDRTGETNRKKDACWLIKTDGLGNIKIERIGYKERPPKEKQAEKGIEPKGRKDIKPLIDIYGGREVLNAVAEGIQIQSIEETVKKLDETLTASELEDGISHLVFERIVDKRINEEGSGKVPPGEYLEILMESMDEELYFGDASLIEKKFTAKQKEWFNGLFGNRTIKKIEVGLEDDAQKILHFLLLTLHYTSEIPTLDEAKKYSEKKGESDPLWKYINMSYEEYKAMYLQAAKDVAAEALKPKGKKKAEVVKKKTAHDVAVETKAVEESLAEDGEDDDDYPFSSDPGADYGEQAPF